jgi:calcineurin-like phosphoesterase family protein
MKRSIWFGSDMHFHHDNILKFTDRPYKTVKEMNKGIIKKWNKQVKPNDLVYILGDFIWNTTKLNEYKKIMCRLNGIKYLIVGNHDDIKTARGMNMGFSAVLHGAEIRIGKELVVLSHYPYRYRFWADLAAKLRCFFQTGKFPKVRHKEKRPINNGKWLLHGHTHSKEKLKNKMIHIGWDAWGRLVSMNEIQQIILDNSR